MASSKDTLTDRRWIDRSMTGMVLATVAGSGVATSGFICLLIYADRDDVDVSQLKLKLTLWCISGALAGLALGIVCLRKALYRTLALMVSFFFLLFVATYSFLVEQKNGGNGLSPLPIAGWQLVAYLLIAGSVAWCLRRAHEAAGHVKPVRRFGASALVSAAALLFAAWIWAFGVGSSKPQQQMQTQNAPTTLAPTPENIRHVIATTLNVPEEKVVPTARFEEDLNVAEPDIGEMMDGFQSTFGVDRQPDDDEMLITVQDALEYVQSPQTFRSAHAGQSKYAIPEPYPEGLRFSPTNQWVKVEGDEASIGMTRHAQQSVAFVGEVHGLPQIGATVSAGEAYATVDEGMSGAVLLAPVSGLVTAVNEEATHSSKINKDPYGAWIIKVRLTNPDELKNLLSPAEYREFVEAGH